MQQAAVRVGWAQQAAVRAEAESRLQAAPTRSPMLQCQRPTATCSIRVGLGGAPGRPGLPMGNYSPFHGLGVPSTVRHGRRSPSHAAATESTHWQLRVSDPRMFKIKLLSASECDTHCQ